MSVAPFQLAQAIVQRKAALRAGHERLAHGLREKLAPVAQTLGARRVWLIGSLAHGTWGAASDVDVVVEGLDAAAIGRAWSQLERALQVKVDLLAIEELPSSFADRVRREGVVLV